MARKLLMRLRVREVHQESSRVKSFTLLHEERPSLPPFEAGAHVTVVLPSGIRRPYSLCSDPADLRFYRIGVLREDGGSGGSLAMHKLQPGDRIFVSYPANNFPLAEQAAFHLLIAGGIGITPMLAMARTLKAKQARFRLHYCAVREDEMAYLDELRHLCDDGELRLHTSRDPIRPNRLDVRTVLTGLHPGAHVYCCGPRRLLDEVVSVSQSVGLPSEALHIERFEGLAADVRRHGEPFQIEIASTGQTVDVPENKSALDVLRENNIFVDASCQGGVCGTCRVRYLAGEPVHRDLALPADERTHTVLVCVSRAKGKLVLAL